MFRPAIERWFFRRFRFHFSTCIKSILCLFIIYLLNLLTGVQYYIWSEKSFENEYHLRMTKIDLTKLDEQHPENSLGEPRYILSNQFIIKNEYLCHSEESQPHLIILVKSAIENWKAREAIRMTWAKKTFLEENSIQIAFVLGISEHNISIEKESQKYGDIIQIDKIDSYYHNSYKMIMMLRWINNYCTSNNLQQYVLFLDDDYYLNLNTLKIYLNQIDQNSDMTLNDRRTFLTGYLYKNSRPRRFLNDRWYISIADYPYDRYPPYVTAGCFLMSRSNVRLFYLASKYVRLFRFDDIYMGMLAYSMSIEIVPNNQLFSSYGSTEIVFDNSTGVFSRLKRFFRSKNSFNPTIQSVGIHGYRGEDLINVWNQIYQTNLTLPVVL